MIPVLKKSWQRVNGSDRRLQLSPCCRYPVESKTTTDRLTTKIREESGKRAEGKLIMPDSYGYIYGYCQKCSDVVCRVSMGSLEDSAVGLIVEIWDYPGLSTVQPT